MTYYKNIYIYSPLVTYDRKSFGTVHWLYCKLTGRSPEVNLTLCCCETHSLLHKLSGGVSEETTPTLALSILLVSTHPPTRPRTHARTHSIVPARTCSPPFTTDEPISTSQHCDKDGTSSIRALWDKL